ncbi:DUF6143 family protein [Bacillus carboniphilus]|uniref:DUF6143 family protein n=1 Tax=Bacillus carboniphilus TaxID=86663 RepID=A0ABY9JSV9_9BACI|nr:DUF6143 family protein [Bacillus carboniphilus]WLR42484.1 DUF6143 family protein [Bacillus carboniphilus]
MTEKIPPVVTVTNSAFESTKGVLFQGKSPILLPDLVNNAWGGLFNPSDSQLNLFLGLGAISNFSNTVIKVGIFLNSKPPGTVFESPQSAPLKIGSDNKPFGTILYNQSIQGEPIGGTEIVSLSVGPFSTFSDFSILGRVIVQPGTNILFFLSSEESTEASVTFSWWESVGIVC